MYDGMKENFFGAMQDRSVCLEARRGIVTRTPAASVGSVTH